MGKTIAQKIFDAHQIDKPFEDTTIVKLDAVFAMKLQRQLQLQING